MDGRTGGHLRPTLLGRLAGVNLKSNTKYKMYTSGPHVRMCFLFTVFLMAIVKALGVFSVLLAATEAGAKMDAMYHPGIWRSVNYTCCYAVNKRADGCTPTTRKTVDGTDMTIREQRSRQSTLRSVTTQKTPPQRKKHLLLCLVIGTYLH